MEEKIPQAVLDMIEQEVEKYSFRVPYDGTNNFYDDKAAEHFTNGANYAYSTFATPLKDEIKILEEREVLWSNKVSQLNDRIKELETDRHRACPCTYLDEPCHENCTCKVAGSSLGCTYCCTYGGYEQRKQKAITLKARFELIPQLQQKVSQLEAEIKELKK